MSTKISLKLVLLTISLKYVTLIIIKLSKEKAMFKIKVADFIVEIDNKYQFITQICKDYLYVGDGCDFRVSSTDEEIEQQQIKLSREFPNASEEFAEATCIYREVCLRLPERDAFVMHCATIGVGDKAYAFTARSGTGKSTHIRLWKQLLGEKVYVINGDKPIVRLIDGELYAYGTPWCGKEMWQTNTRAKLDGLCFLQRAEKNFITDISKQEAATLIMKQILIPNDPLAVSKTFELVDRMINKTKLYRLGCNISIEAAEIAYNAMCGGKNED